MGFWGTIDTGSVLAIAIGVLLGAGGSLWFINRAVTGEQTQLDPAVKRRIRKALFEGSAVDNPSEAGIAAESAAAHRAGLRAARGTLIAYLVMATIALAIAIAISDSLVIGMTAIIILLATVASVGSALLTRRLSKAETANRIRANEAPYSVDGNALG